ncbi:MAG TPA: C45 family peptidase [Candidatus Saccharimonadales bacterium]|nr:C45 family peptidase [Candidatus Saccharimonadales bacterium]
MKKLIAFIVVIQCSLLLSVRAEEEKTPAEIFGAAVNKLVMVLDPGTNAPTTFSTRLKITHATGDAKVLEGREGALAYQAPNRLLLAAEVDKVSYRIGRDGQELWAFVPTKHFGAIGKSGVPRFASAPEKLDHTSMEDLRLPIPREQIALLPMLSKVELIDTVTNESTRVFHIKAQPLPETRKALKLLPFTIEARIRESDFLPQFIGYNDGKGFAVDVEFSELKLEQPWPAEKWKLHAGPEDKIEITALGHLTKFIEVSLGALGDKVKPLGPLTGDRHLVAAEGQGRLEMIDGTRVLFLKGTPVEMGRQQGVLLKKEIRRLVDRILYGVGVGSSFQKGKWFFGEIEQAQNRLNPFMDPRYLEEMDALALASGTQKEEIRLANFFPELFHCSGFALLGDATVDGKMYHGRILDYLKGVGLEQSAVVTIVQPDKGNAWVNINYAGFIGSVTAMNEKHVAIGEMGGRGEGNWDGKPMAELVREVMEKASTLEEAVEIMRKGPRTCEYYYVISDAKSKKAVGIAATPTTFETVWPGEKHAQLPHGIKDTVLMSAGNRYEKLVERVKSGYGKFDAETARDLMCRPVAMNSNIHSVLFAPDTLDFWVANADSKNVASHARYTHYNLGELLNREGGLPAAHAAQK